jgi:hypothetical protein
VDIVLAKNNTIGKTDFCSQFYLLYPTRTTSWPLFEIRPEEYMFSQRTIPSLDHTSFAYGPCPHPVLTTTINNTLHVPAPFYSTPLA